MIECYNNSDSSSERQIQRLIKELISSAYQHLLILRKFFLLKILRSLSVIMSRLDILNLQFFYSLFFVKSDIWKTNNVHENKLLFITKSHSFPAIDNWESLKACSTLFKHGFSVSSLTYTVCLSMIFSISKMFFDDCEHELLWQQLSNREMSLACRRNDSPNGLWWFGFDGKREWAWAKSWWEPPDTAVHRGVQTDPLDRTL